LDLTPSSGVTAWWLVQLVSARQLMDAVSLAQQCTWRANFSK
jgi:hypothetical protein